MNIQGGILISLFCTFLALAHGENLPSSPLSRTITAKLAPRLSVELKNSGFSLGAPVFIRIFKESRTLELFIEKDHKFTLFRTYEICSFSGELGPKQRVGDLQSPEGFYFVTPSQLNPFSRFHLSFNLGYPNLYDRAYGRTGSALMVHGNCVSIGCYAMTNARIEEIYTIIDAAFRKGQPYFRVHAFPFKMTESKLQEHSNSPWFSFWKNLQEGYDFFERTRRPPDVQVRNKKYIFGAE